MPQLIGQCETAEFKAPEAATPSDIEHTPVENDPRTWSAIRKNISLFLISSASMFATMAGSVQNPAVAQMLEDLHATNAQFSLSIAAFILVQGSIPMLWTSFSEIKGRKNVYVVSLVLAIVGSVGSALSKSIKLVIGFRVLQAAGVSAAISVGGATLADMFDPMERGRKMGIYYMSPLLGSAIGPILGGGLTVRFGWRAIFWFMAIFAGVLCFSFLLFFHDTFRKERSLTYQTILKQRYAARSIDADRASEKNANRRSPQVQPMHDEIKLSLKDVNPFKPICFVLRRWNNVVILIASALIFSFNFFILYVSARTLSFKYHYSPLKIGAVLLAYGFGCVSGSLLGGRWSDHTFARLKALNGNVIHPEQRLHAAIHSIFLAPPSAVGLGWSCKLQAHVSVVCIMLDSSFNANLGRSSAAFATNSACRGFGAFIATEIAVPLQDNIGDGYTFTFWGGLILISGILIILVCWRGERWRKAGDLREGLVSLSPNLK